MTPVAVTQGGSPIILGMPHTGTYLPADISEQLTPLGRTRGDTDWHVDKLYDGLLDDVTIVRARFHRYVVDANRDPSGASLYPGQNTTGLVPQTDFDGEPLWIAAPSPEDIASRRRAWHAPYHAALSAEIERVKSLRGAVILFDCHSIRSRIPFLFEGVLPDFNIGTNGGETCAPEVERTVHEICAAAAGFTCVLNGRFKGGWTTRHYGRPADGVHAIQMELAQATYLKSESAPFEYDDEKARRVRIQLKTVLESLLSAAAFLGGKV